MRKIVFEDISIFVVKHIFHLRFRTAQLSRDSRIMNKIITRMLFHKDGTYFIPNNNSVSNIKTETIDINQNFELPKEIVFPSDILKQMIKKANHIVIMNKCLCRRSSNCEDYPVDLGCIFMGNATKQISRKHCREVTAEEAIEHVDKCNEAGLIHIMGRNKIDNIWMHVSPGDELMTVCNCCPCCCLWRVYPNLSDNIQNKFYKLPGVSVYCENDDCVLCQKCIDVCYTNAISITDNKIVIDEDICVGCGQCSNNCPVKAIHLDYNKENVQSVFDKLDSLVNIEN